MFFSGYILVRYWFIIRSLDICQCASVACRVRIAYEAGWGGYENVVGVGWECASSFGPSVLAHLVAADEKCFLRL